MALTAGEESAAPRDRPYPGLRGDAPLLVAAGVAGALAFWLVHRALVDDSYITMTYARNLAFDLHWGLVPGETANSATSPLNVLLLAAVTAVVRNPFLAVGVLFVATVVVMARWFAALSQQLSLSRATPWIGTGLLLASPLLLSTVGLESYLAVAVVVGLVRYGAAARPVAFGVLAGVAVLVRPDLGVVVVVAALGFAGVRTHLLQAVAAGLAVALPWHLWSWFALGSAVPDTLLVKAGQGTWGGGYGFATGPLMYVDAFPVATVLSFLPVVLGAAALLAVVLRMAVGRRDEVQGVVVVAACATAAHYAAYAVLGTPPYHWYYAPLIAGGSVCTALVVGRVLVRVPAAAGLAVAAVPVVLTLAMVGFDVLRDAPGTWQRAAIGSNWASPAQYERIGHDLVPLVGDSAVESPGEIGTMAYYCGCAIVDVFSDRGRMIDTIEQREARSGTLARALIRLNYLHLDRSEEPRPTAFRLEFRRDRPSEAVRSWPVQHWAEGPGQMLLLPPR